MCGPGAPVLVAAQVGTQGTSLLLLLYLSEEPYFLRMVRVGEIMEVGKEKQICKSYLLGEFQSK